MPEREGIAEFSLADATIERGPQYQTFYSNLAQVMAGQFDISITFAEVVDTKVIQQKCRIVMHPKLAEALVKTITDTLEKRRGMFEKLKEQTATPSETSEPAPQL